MMKKSTRSVWRMTAVVLALGVGAVSMGCSSSNRFKPTGNPLLDLRNPELLERDRVAAARLAWDQVNAGVRVRERTRQALKNLAWSNSTSPELRLVVLDLLMSDQSQEGSADSRIMARLLLPTEHSPDAIRILSDRAVEGRWVELVPALVRSYARVSPNVPDRDRDELGALLALEPGKNVQRIVFDVFLHPSRGLSGEREQAVLRLSQRTRDDAWGLLARLDPSGELRRALIRTDSYMDDETEADSRVLVGDIRAGQQDLGVIPDTAMEIGWLSNLRHHADKRNARLNKAWWTQTKEAVAKLGEAQREGLTMRHLEPVRWASVNRPAWLSLDRDSLFGLAYERINPRKHHKRRSVKGERRRFERLGDWRDELGWGDLLSILVVDQSLADPDVIEQLFTQRVLDTKDDSTEYGGVIEWGKEHGFRALLFRPRSRDRIDDQRFVASDDMFRFSDRSLAHYHFHADKRNNGRFSGPSIGDMINAAASGRTSLVFTSLGTDHMNVDLYQPNGVVVDLGEISRAK